MIAVAIKVLWKVSLYFCSFKCGVNLQFEKKKIKIKKSKKQSQSKIERPSDLFPTFVIAFFWN